jgi:hypothetical protein
MPAILQTIPATIDTDGRMQLLQPVRLAKPARAVVSILEDDSSEKEASETAILSGQSLATDWNRPEEDEAWSHLQRGPVP